MDHPIRKWTAERRAVALEPDGRSNNNETSGELWSELRLQAARARFRKFQLPAPGSVAWV
jgi:hypothetical protein